MGPKQLPLISATAVLLALGSGCMTSDAAKTQAKKADVTKPGVLPSPQEVMTGVRSAPQGGGVVQAGGAQADAPEPANPATKPAAGSPVLGAPALAKLKSRLDKKVPASEMEVGWRNYIEQLPDPSRNGALGAGLVGQMYLFGGPKLQFIEADGVLTVDLVDVTPRPAGQKAATPERWQFNKEMLRQLKAHDETFGYCYALFLPWPAYRPDITNVRIAARYDSEDGQTLYATPTVVTLTNSKPKWDSSRTSIPLVEGGPQFGVPGMMPGGMMPGGIPPGVMRPDPAPPTAFPPPSQPLPFAPIPLSPGGPSGGAPPAPGGTMPLAPAAPPAEVAPLGITINR